MNMNLMKMTRTVYHSFYEDGCLLASPVGAVKSAKLSDEAVQFLREYITFVMNSKILNWAGETYIKHPFQTASVENVFKYWNSQHKDDQVTVKTAISNCDSSRRRMIKAFDADMVYELLYMKHTDKLNHYREQLEAAMEKYCGDKVFKSTLTIHIPVMVGPDVVTPERLEEFKEAVAPYRIAIKDTIEETLTSTFADVIRYINRVQRSTDRTPEEQEDLDDLVQFLSGKPSKKAKKKDYEVPFDWQIPDTDIYDPEEGVEVDIGEDYQSFYPPVDDPDID